MSTCTADMKAVALVSAAAVIASASASLESLECAGCPPPNLLQECSISSSCDSGICVLLPSTATADCHCPPRYKCVSFGEPGSASTLEKRLDRDDLDMTALEKRSGNIESSAALEKRQDGRADPYVKNLIFDKDGYKDTLGPEWSPSAVTGSRKNVQVSKSGELIVRFPKNSRKSPSKGGYQFDARPLSDESDTMNVEYDLFVPSDFEFARGGKLPGLFAGESLSGGNNRDAGDKGTSLRLMWRANGQLEVYLYGPITEDDPICKLKGSHCNPQYGTSLMRGRLSLVPGQVNRISLAATMNTVGQNNGLVLLGLNGKTETLGGITFRKRRDLKWTGIFFSTFFGGSTSAWASPKSQYLTFGNFATGYAGVSTFASDRDLQDNGNNAVPKEKETLQQENENRDGTSQQESGSVPSNQEIVPPVPQVPVQSTLSEKHRTCEEKLSLCESYCSRGKCLPVGVRVFGHCGIVLCIPN